MKQHDNSSQEHVGIGMVPTIDTKSTSGQAPHEGSSMELCLTVDHFQGRSGFYHFQGSSLSFPPVEQILALGYKINSPKIGKHEVAARGPIFQ